MNSSKIKLVIITSVDLSWIFYKGQTYYLKTKGYELYGICSPSHDFGRLAREHGAEFHGVRLKRGISPLSDLVALVSLYRIFKKIAPEIVHASTPKASFLSISAAWAARVPVRIYTIRGLMTEMYSGFKGRLFRALEKITCALAHRVLANSKSVRDAIITQNLCDPEKICVTANGSGNGVDFRERFNVEKIDPAASQTLRTKLGIDKGAMVVGFIGRLVKDKGVEELARSWEIVLREAPGARLLIIGKPEERNAVSRDSLEYLKSEKTVIMIDWVDQAEIPLYYKVMDLLVLPTYREGLPNVVLEASAMEIPVVATRVTGCVDAVEDGATGTLVPAKDPVALAEAIFKYLHDPNLRDAHGNAGRKMVMEKFDPMVVWEFIANEYEKQLKDKGIIQSQSQHARQYLS
jgi:glycosyltransferase involved in cell wall biosynthesis